MPRTQVQAHKSLLLVCHREEGPVGAERLEKG